MNALLAPFLVHLQPVALIAWLVREGMESIKRQYWGTTETWQVPTLSPPPLLQIEELTDGLGVKENSTKTQGVRRTEAARAAGGGGALLASMTAPSAPLIPMERRASVAT